MLIAHNSISSMLCTFELDARIAREVGYDGLALAAPKVMRYLRQGFSIADARAVLDGVPVFGLGYVRDIERSKKRGRADLFAETETVCRLAQDLGAASVQLLVGPVEPCDEQRTTWVKTRRDTVENLRTIAGIGRACGVGFYVEALAWSVVGSLQRTVELVSEAAEENVGLSLDFWHAWNQGATPDEVASLDGSLIRSVDFCDSLGTPGQMAGPDQAGRDVWTGGGSIPLKEWVDAVRSTGYDDWWSCELLSPHQWELDPWTTAADHRSLLIHLLQ